MKIESVTYKFCKSNKDLTVIAEVKFERNYCFNVWEVEAMKIVPNRPKVDVSYWRDRRTFTTTKHPSHAAAKRFFDQIENPNGK